MAGNDPAGGMPKEEGLEEAGGLAGRVAEWVQQDAPSWLLSLMLHMVILLVIGLTLGGAAVKRMIENAPVFESAQIEKPAEQEVQRFEIGEAPIDPSELTTESLTMKDQGGQIAQEAMFYDDSDKFEEEGGGSMAGKETAAAGLGFNLKAAGLGPILQGGGGAELGKGEGTAFGRGGGGAGFGGRGKGHREALLGRFGGTKQTERAVAGALNWLARHQNPEGSWSVDKFNTRCKGGTCSGVGSVQSDSGGTALGLLPFLAAGQTHLSKGPYQKQIARAVQWLMKNQATNGDLSARSDHQMYAHGLAAIAVCEAYGMTGDPAVGKAAQLAIQFTQDAQNKEGGWRYTPGTIDGDTSVLGWHMMALKSATMAGLSVDPAKLERGRKWLDLVSEGAQVPAAMGQFGYRIKAPPTPCMTAVALLILQYTGSSREDPLVKGGIKYLMGNQPNRDDRNVYYWYYGTQVLHNMVGTDWDTWNRKIRRILVEDQVKTGCASGSWDPEKPDQDSWGPQGGRLMMTSLAALTLEVYYRYLPLYKLDKPAEKKEK